MTDQQYLELGQEVAAYVYEFEQDNPDPTAPNMDWICRLSLAEIIRMVTDRQPEPDDGP
jgi:hypothetical protein